MAPQQTRTLCLDLGTNTGWAVLGAGAGELIAHDWQPFKKTQLEGFGARFLRFGRWLRGMIEDNGVTAVVFEEVVRHGGGSYAAQVYGAFVGQLAAVCEELGIEYEGVNVTVVKRNCALKGNAKKAEVIESVIKVWSLPLQPGDLDDNQADALAIAYYVDQTRRVAS